MRRVIPLIPMALALVIFDVRADGALDAPLDNLKKGFDKAAARQLKSLAEVDDDRAQYILGRLYIEGRGVPVDLAQAYAWLEIAASAYPGKYGGSSKAAKAAMAEVGPQLSGADLIRADQIAGSFISMKEKEIAELSARAYRALLRQDSARAGDRTVGCAGDPNLKGCSKASQGREVDSPRCTGQVVQPDVAASFDRLTPGPDPDYPKQARRTGMEGAVVLMAHIDRSGDVCAMVPVKSSGSRMLDDAAMEQLRLWRFRPGLKDGQPVESTYTFTFQFVLGKTLNDI